MSFDHRDSVPDQSAPKFEKRDDDSFPIALSEDNTIGSNEDTETDSSSTESLISDTYDAMAALSDLEEEAGDGLTLAYFPSRCQNKLPPVKTTTTTYLIAGEEDHYA
ncbi:hypothetical protein L1887_11444 [Cichorium endivia]|nr:hypothetical protein L1887_11444 [Cichorium endivia]